MNRKISKGLLTLFVFLGLIWVYILTASMGYAQEVYVNHQNGTIPEDMVEHAAWAGSLRTGMDTPYMGETSQACVYGEITARYATAPEWASVAAQQPTARATVANCDLGDGIVILYNPSVPPTHHTTTHELSHALGCFAHFIFPYNVLYAPSIVDTLTAEDTNCILANPIWPVVDTPDKCFAEYSPDGWLYIPEIGGGRATLKYVDMGDGYQSFELRNYSPVSGTCNNATISATEAILTDVKVFGLGDFSYVRLEKSGAVWRLMEAE